MTLILILFLLIGFQMVWNPINPKVNKPLGTQLNIFETHPNKDLVRWNMEPLFYTTSCGDMDFDSWLKLQNYVYNPSGQPVKKLQKDYERLAY